MTITPQIEQTLDGSPTLRHPATGETYHSLRGALGESLHVFIGNGLRRVSKEHIRIFEVGFGSGLNAWLTLRHALENGIMVEYGAVEMYPVNISTVAALCYTDDPLFMALHTAPWNESVAITPTFGLTKIEGDLTDMDFESVAGYKVGNKARGEACDRADDVVDGNSGGAQGAGYDLIYFDAFAPDIQPELWTTETFSRLRKAMAPNGILVTYSAKGSVKRALREAGFQVERLEGALGKRHMVRAINN